MICVANSAVGTCVTEAYETEMRTHPQHLDSLLYMPSHLRSRLLENTAAAEIIIDAMPQNLHSIV